MAREADDKRYFVLREESGEETSVFTGKVPRQAAMKAARKLDPSESEDAAPREEFRLRERGTHKLHIYEGWAWREAAPEDSPEWMPETVTEANVAKQGIEHLEEL